MLSPSIPCKGLRPLTHSRDFVGCVCIQLPRADFALIYNLLMSIGESAVYHFRHHRRASADVP